MRAQVLSIAIAASMACAACSASYPAPTQRMADAMSAERSAEEVGANTEPQAQLHVKLAQEEIARAKSLMADGENRRADFVLVRAKGDAELALALARATNAKVEAQRAMAQVDAARNASSQGAPQ